MPRFYFDIEDAGCHHRDHDGFELADLASARDEAIGTLHDVARDKLPDTDRWEMLTSVRDETGHVVFRATLSFSFEWLDGRPLNAKADNSNGH